jgi:hypothetical protein
MVTYRLKAVVVASALSIAAFGLTPLSYAREAPSSDHRGRHEHAVQEHDDRRDRMVEVQQGDDRGVDVAPHERANDDFGVDPQPHA